MDDDGSVQMPLLQAALCWSPTMSQVHDKLQSLLRTLLPCSAQSPPLLHLDSPLGVDVPGMDVNWRDAKPAIEGFFEKLTFLPAGGSPKPLSAMPATVHPYGALQEFVPHAAVRAAAASTDVHGMNVFCPSEGTQASHCGSVAHEQPSVDLPTLEAPLVDAPLSSVEDPAATFGALLPRCSESFRERVPMLASLHGAIDNAQMETMSLLKDSNSDRIPVLFHAAPAPRLFTFYQRWIHTASEGALDAFQRFSASLFGSVGGASYQCALRLRRCQRDPFGNVVEACLGDLLPPLDSQEPCHAAPAPKSLLLPTTRPPLALVRVRPEFAEIESNMEAGPPPSRVHCPPGHGSASSVTPVPTPPTAHAASVAAKTQKQDAPLRTACLLKPVRVIASTSFLLDRSVANALQHDQNVMWTPRPSIHPFDILIDERSGLCLVRTDQVRRWGCFLGHVLKDSATDVRIFRRQHEVVHCVPCPAHPSHPPTVDRS